MLLIEFEENQICGLNILKYRNVEDNMWHYLYIDIETLKNFGIISTKKMPGQHSNSKQIHMFFCNAPISLSCREKNTRFSHFNLSEL